MNYIIGLILCLASIFKINDWFRFAEEFQQYDMIAKRFPFYAFLFPVIELVLGLAFLNQFMPILVNTIAVIILSVTLFGVLKGINVIANRAK